MPTTVEPIAVTGPTGRRSVRVQASVYLASPGGGALTAPGLWGAGFSAGVPTAGAHALASATATPVILPISTNLDTVNLRSAL
jgi:hypothetical protein